MAALKVESGLWGDTSGGDGYTYLVLVHHKEQRGGERVQDKEIIDNNKKGDGRFHPSPYA